MTTTLKRSITLLFVAVMLAGCTHNNGDIGRLFGTWRLDHITLSKVGSDGQGQMVSSQEVNDVFWAFQSEVVMMERIYGTHEALKVYGSWSRDDSRLSLDFTHSDDENGDPGTGKYAILSELGLPAGGAVLEIHQLERSTMVLTYTTADSEAMLIYTYFFTKW